MSMSRADDIVVSRRHFVINLWGTGAAAVVTHLSLVLVLLLELLLVEIVCKTFKKRTGLEKSQHTYFVR